MNYEKKNKSYTKQDFYNKVYSDIIWENLRREDAIQLIKKSNLNISKKDKVIDIGCGTGVLGEEIIKKFGCKVDGVELNDNAIKISKEKGLNVFKSDLDDPWKLDDSTYDYVFSTEMIEHVINTDHFVLESKRILKNNGKIILTTPNLTCWYNRILFLLGYQPFYTEVSTLDKTIGLDFTRKITENRTPVGHIRVFSHRAIRDMLEFHGFTNVKIYGLKILYIPPVMKFIDDVLSNIPWLASDLLIIAEKKQL